MSVPPAPRFALVAALLLAASIITGCGSSRKDLPPVPELNLASFSDNLRERLKPVYDRARSNPDDSEAVGELGLLLEAHQLLDAAETAFVRARGLAPESFRWIYHLGLTRAAAGKHREAIPSLREALQQKPDYTAARLQLADALVATGEHEEAEKLYREVIEKVPEFAQAHYGLGRIAAARRDPEAAAGHLERAVALYPDFGAARYALALAQRQKGDQAGSKQNMALYEKNRLGAPPTRDELYDAMARLNEGPLELVRRGQGFEQRGQLREAIATHLEALQMDAKFEQAHVNLISLYGRLGETANAEKHYHEAIRLNPSHAEAHYNYGVLLFNQKRTREAREAFERAIQSNPGYPEALNNLGYILMEEGKLAQAAGYFEKALSNNPNHKLAHYHLARILLHQGKRDQGVQHLEQAAAGDLTSETPMLTFALAAAYAQYPDQNHRRQAYAKAQEAYDAAMRLEQRELAARISQDLPRFSKLAGSSK